MRITVIFLVLYLCTSMQGSCGINDSVIINTDTASVLGGWIKDHGQLWTSPLRLKKQDVFLWAPVIAATGFSIMHDEAIYASFKNYQSTHLWVDKWSPIITLGGDGGIDLGVGALFYIGGHLFKNEKALQTGMMSMHALVHSGIIVIVGKLAFSRKRPHAGGLEDLHGIDRWSFFPAGLREYTHDESRSRYDAFPSGHTISAFSVASVIALQYKETVWVPVISFGAATAVALSRVTEDTHWFSDVIMGGAMGYCIGRYMVRNNQDTRWTLLPTAWNKNVGLTGVYKFK